jgi:hypothetical protein
MTLPAPKTGEPHEWRTAVMNEGADPVSLITSDCEDRECPDLDSLSDEEKDAQVRDAIIWLSGTLRAGPQPLRLVLDLLESSLDLSPCCAERIFWHAHEKGYVSLSRGEVHLGHILATH